jgi:hypothetical protein
MLSRTKPESITSWNSERDARKAGLIQGGENGCCPGLHANLAYS